LIQVAEILDAVENTAVKNASFYVKKDHNLKISCRQAHSNRETFGGSVAPRFV